MMGDDFATGDPRGSDMLLDCCQRRLLAMSASRTLSAPMAAFLGTMEIGLGKLIGGMGTWCSTGEAGRGM